MSGHFVAPPKSPFSDVPVIGPWIAKIGRIIDLWGNPCSPSPTIWVLAFFQALPTLLISPIAPSATDYLIRRVGFGGGGFHSRRSKFKFDVFEFEQLEQQRPSAPEWLVFELGKWGARALWYFAIADATIDFIINWESLAYQWAGCHAPGSPWASCSLSSPRFYIAGLDGDNFHFFDTVSGHVFNADAEGISSPPGFAPTVSWSVTHTCPDPPGSLCGIPDWHLIDTVTGDDYGSGTTNINADGSHTTNFLTRNYFSGTGHHAYALKNFGPGFCWITSATMDANSAALEDIFHPLVMHEHPKYKAPTD